MTIQSRRGTCKRPTLRVWRVTLIRMERARRRYWWARRAYRIIEPSGLAGRFGKDGPEYTGCLGCMPKNKIKVHEYVVVLLLGRDKRLTGLLGDRESPNHQVGPAHRTYTHRTHPQLPDTRLSPIRYKRDTARGPTPVYDVASDAHAAISMSAYTN